MLRQVAVGLAGLAAIGFAAPAMAVTDTHDVLVNITVAPNVSFWADHGTVNLLLDGGPANDDAFESGFSVINNVDAKVDVEVNGILPTPIVAGGGVNFFLFYGIDAATAQNSIHNTDGPLGSCSPPCNAYNPAGSLAWTQATLGTSQQLTPSVGVNTSIAHKLVTYAAAAPGELPLPDTFALTVTYTLSSLP